MHYRAVHRAIAKHHLDSAPVSVQWIRDSFDVRFLPILPDARGIAFRYRRHRVIVVDESLHPYEQRAVLGHEAAHFLLGHLTQGSMLACHYVARLALAHERDAEWAASLMLVPFDFLVSRLRRGYSCEAIAAECEVPVGLVRMRLDPAAYFAPPQQIWQTVAGCQ